MKKVFAFITSNCRVRKVKKIMLFPAFHKIKSI